MKILGAILIFFALSIPAFAQVSADANVTASIIQGLTITNVGGSSIDFGEIVTSTSAQNPTVDPNNGANFEVTGESNHDITVTFNNVTLDDGGSNTMVFTPSVEHTGTSSTYSSGTAVTSGGTVNLGDVSGTGTLYLWAGGSLAVGANQATGSYSGTFTVTVAYP